MADTLTITLPAPLADEVRAAAEARGMTPDDYVREQLTEDIAFGAEPDDLDWEEDERRIHEPGESIPLDVAMERFRGAIAAERSGKK
jgi:hypothetical protein